MNRDDFKKNAPNWKASDKDYRLVFRVVDGLWREISNNLPQFYNMVLADYLAQVDIEIPDGCRMLRIRRGSNDWFIRQWGALIVIDYDEIEE